MSARAIPFGNLELAGSALRQVGLLLTVPGAVVTFVALVAVGRVWGWAFWPAFVFGVGLCCLGAGTLLNPMEVVDESDDVEFGYYAVRTPGEAKQTGLAFLIGGLLFVAFSVIF